MANIAFFKRRRLASFISLAIVCLIALNLFSKAHIFDTHGDCARHPDPGNIAIIVKTGATEATERLPTSFATSFRCISDPILVSDLEAHFGSRKIYDVLANFSPNAMDSNPDFDLYRLQLEYAQSDQRQNIPSLSTMPMANAKWYDGMHKAPWALDKYKFLHTFELAWNLQPGKDWYIMLEADTYLHWPSFLEWIRELDPTQRLYFGNAVRMWSHPEPMHFGHGGSGILLSGALMKDWMTNHLGLAGSWDSRIHEMEFGDYVLALALRDGLGVAITNTFPSFHGDRPDQMAFGEDFWCKPVLTQHHMDASSLQSMLALEQRVWNRPMQVRDLFPGTGALHRLRHEWNNFADDVRFLLDNPESRNTTDPQTCALACGMDERCLQWNFLVEGNGLSRCFRSWVWRFGERKQGWDSGDAVERVEKLGKKECRDTVWPTG